MVASDRLGVVDNVGWHERDYIGYPDVKVVFPGQDDQKVPVHPNISPGNKKPRLLYIGAVITYRGPQRDTTYWFKFSELFVIEFAKGKDKEGNDVEYIALHPHSEHDWDRNTNEPPPKLEEPNWQEFLSKSYVKTLTQSQDETLKQ